ncbi:MAG: DUF1080 domain-containing protein [Pirellulaceae bacterium]|nr:DUF1080 domain-containing protein [Pirellulaceae bacterium]
MPPPHFSTLDAMRPALLVWIITTTAATCFGQVYDTPEQAMEDPDFALQGEYVDTTRGLQVIAMGDGEFQVVTYTDGLPGAGWNGKDKKSIEVDDATLETLLRNFKRVNRQSPSLGAKPPSGSVVLFDGSQKSLNEHWKDGAKITDDGLLVQGCTSIDTFGDYTLHLEFRTPFAPGARGQGRGNSGLYHQGRYETQILDSFGLDGKMNETGGLYSIRAPDLNMCLPPLTWQTYDVDFTTARFDSNGKKTANARITVKLNGVVVHRDVELPKSTTAAPVKEGPENGPIYLQDHGNPVRYRNIWVRPRDLQAEARRPIVPAFERFHSAAGDGVNGGRLLLSELNCVACHAAPEQLASLVQPKKAPNLDKVGERVHPEWMMKYLADPHAVKPGTTMPDVLAEMSSLQRTEAAIALTHFLVGQDTIVSSGDSGDPIKGATLFHESGCVACHLARNDKKVNAATSIPLVGIEEKYSRASLEQFLKDPLAVRPSGRMPQLNLAEENVRHIAQYLTGDTTTIDFGDQRHLPEEPNMRFAAYYKGVSQMPKLDGMTPDKTGVSRGLDISVGQRNSDVILRFDGFLPIAKTGSYSFRLGSDDGSMLYIAGKRVIDNDGVHPHSFKEKTLKLKKGVHAIRVEYFESGGEESLTLDWAGPGVQPGRLDHAIVMDRESAVATQSATSVDSPTPTDQEPASSDDESDSYVYNEAIAQQGRQLFSQLGCAACHVRNDDGKPMSSSLTAPALVDCDASKGCLSAEPTSTPDYDLTSVQTDALAAALRAGQPAEPFTADARLVHTMKTLNCYACHERDGLGGSESDRNSVFVSTIPEMGDEGRLPPPLDGVGDKLREDWIHHVVSKGDKSRPYMKTYMPRFGEKNAGHLAKIFASLDQRTEAEITPIADTPKKRVTLGRQLVGSKGLACVSCHTYGEFKSSGIQAIALDTMTKRIREDWFHRYLPNPQQYRPGTRMPTGYPEGKSTVMNIYDGHQSKQLSAIWAFLEKGADGGVPEGIVGGMKELKPIDRPILYRNFIEGVSPRGIAVGYPEKANLCWDANQMSLALIWQDRFIDASKHWDGRGQGTQSPLGGGVTKWESVSPIAVLEDLETNWPTTSAKERGYRFLGYRLDKQGRPTFRYNAVVANVQDKLIPVAGDLGGTFDRQLIVTPIEGVDIAGTVYFRAAAGNVQPLPDGGFLVDDTVTIRIQSDGAKPIIRKRDGSSEVLIPIAGSTTITQEIIW